MSKPYYQKHRRAQAWLDLSKYRQLENVLKARGLDFVQWLRVMIDKDAAERLPESQGAVKKVIPLEVARVAREALEQQGDFYYRLAQKTSDPLERSRLLKKSGPYYDAASFFGDSLEEMRRRRHLLESGQRQPRHRRKSAAKPATDSNSST